MREFAAECVGKKSTMVKHNAPDVYVLGVSAACHPPAAFAAMEPVLWFEYVRRALGKSDVPQRFGDHALHGDGVSYLPRLTPSDFADQAAPFILQANRFVAALRALNKVVDDVLDNAPATAATLAVLAKAFNDEPVNDTFALAPGVSAGARAAHTDAGDGGPVAEKVPGAHVDAAADDEAKTGSAVGGARRVVVSDPFGRSPEEVLAAAAVAAVMVEQVWRRTHSKPLANDAETVRRGCPLVRALSAVSVGGASHVPLTAGGSHACGVQARARVWLLRSSEMVSRGCSALLDESMEAGALGAMLLRASAAEMLCLGRLFARHMSNDERMRILSGLQALVCLGGCVGVRAAGFGVVIVTHGCSCPRRCSLTGAKEPQCEPVEPLSDAIGGRVQRGVGLRARQGGSQAAGVFCHAASVGCDAAPTACTHVGSPCSVWAS